MTDSDDSLEEQDARVLAQSRTAMSAKIAILDELIISLNHGTVVLAGWKHDDGHQFLLGLMVATAFNHLYRARQDALNGYPVASMALTRAAWETFVARSGSWSALTSTTSGPQTSSRRSGRPASMSRRPGR